LSWRKIPFNLDVKQKAVYSKPVLERLPPGPLVESSDGVCKTCGSTWSSDIDRVKSMPLLDYKTTTVVQGTT
jgi:hypothetical protein